MFRYFHLQRNDFIANECEAYEKIQTLLKNRLEPIFKNKDNQDETSTGGRDTVGTPHSRSRLGLSLLHTNASNLLFKKIFIRENNGKT